MEIRTLKAAEIKAAEYNPRRDLQPEDAEYEKLRRRIEEIGYIEPIIWNERSVNVVGGHQRLKVLLEKGVEDIAAVVVDLDEFIFVEESFTYRAAQRFTEALI